jgi:hypothetical protein
VSKYVLRIDGNTTRHASIKSAEAAMRRRSTMGQIAIDGPVSGGWLGSKARTIRGSGLVYVVYMEGAQALSGDLRLSRD